MKSFVCTWAQSGTPVHPGLWAAIRQYAAHNRSEILVIPGVYRNPTSPEEASRSGEETWADEVTPYLLHGRRSLCRNLRVYGDLRIQPTASRPLTGFEVFAGRVSMIVGHPKRAMEVVPTGVTDPKVFWTTGACTVANYSKSRAGIKGRAHHVLGALVGEVDAKGRYFFRHVTYSKSGGFMDLNTFYGRDGVSKGLPVASVTLGDWHSGQTDPQALVATRNLVKLLQPEHVVLHDVLDFRTRNHHDRSRRSQYAGRAEKVEAEMVRAAEDIRMIQAWGDHETHIVRSNHDAAAERWLEECDPRTDPTNAPYYHRLWAASYEHFEERGEWPDIFAMECGRLGVEAHFLRQDEQLRIAGVEHGMHGDIGANGARGSAKGFSRLGCKVNVGHSHTPCIMDGVFQSGTMNRDMGYNKGPSGWLVAHTVTHFDGKRQLVICVDDCYRGAKSRK